MMRAIVVSDLGSPEVLELRQLPEPQPARGEVVIRPKFIGVNYADIKARRGSYHGAGEPPFVPGLDVCGEIVSVGEGVEGLEEGQLVAAATTGGAYSELVRAREELAFPLPVQADARQAASLIVLMTAHNLLVAKAALEAGERVLVHGAAGGLGSVLLQLAKRLEAGRIVGVVGSEAKREFALQWGADDVIIGRGEAALERVSELPDPLFDVILDPLAGSQLTRGLSLLAPFGRYLVYGNSDGHGELGTGPLHSGNRSVIGYSSGHYLKNRPAGVRKASERMLEMLARGEIEVPIGRIFGLEEAAEAHRFMESRQSTGKLLLKP